MLEIKGKVNTALCYAKVVEDVAIEQIRRMCDYALTEGSRIRIMPDVHAGKGCTYLYAHRETRDFMGFTLLQHLLYGRVDL